MSAVGVKNLYDILGVSRSASQEELKQAYRSAQKRLHPDVSGTGTTDEAVELNNAYETLSDPAKRQEYDARLSRGIDHQGFELYCPHCRTSARYFPDLNQETNVLCCQSVHCRKPFVVRYIDCSTLTPFDAGSGRSRYLVEGEAIDGTDRHAEFEGPAGISVSFGDILLLLYPSEASAPVLLQSSATGRTWDLRSPSAGSASRSGPATHSESGPSSEPQDARSMPSAGPPEEMTTAMMVVGSWRQIYGGLAVAGLAGWWLTQHYLQPVIGRFPFIVICTIAAIFSARAKGRRPVLWAVMSFFTNGALAFVLLLIPARNGKPRITVDAAFATLRTRMTR